ncbi:MAG TPA: hypothetical protein VMF33_06785 [Acidimicrobiales bacterium]|nr:hypothetical protein [Acidimicrobiales bacterium]
MQRVAVVGSPGAGKTSFAELLATVTGLPLIHLDEEFWRPGWIETPREEWIVRQSALVAAERWIIEGNYSATFDVRFARADTVIVLAAPRRVCLYRVLRREIVNWGRETQAPGCPERFDVEFMKLVWKFPRDSAPRLAEALSRFQKSVTVEYLDDERAKRDYLSDLAGLS